MYLTKNVVSTEKIGILWDKFKFSRDDMGGRSVNIYRNGMLLAKIFPTEHEYLKLQKDYAEIVSKSMGDK